jgi:hypothetical protein
MSPLPTNAQRGSRLPRLPPALTRSRAPWRRARLPIAIAALLALSEMLGAPALARSAVRRPPAHRRDRVRCTVSGAPVGTRHVVAAAPGVEMTKVGDNYYGCFAATRKRVSLFKDSGGTLEDRTRHKLRSPHVAGPFAAFVGEVQDPYGAPVESVVTVVDLRTGHVRHTIVECLQSPFACMSSLVLAAGGQVAWMTVPSIDAPPGGPVSVYAKDATGQRMLDSGVDIDPASLTLDGLNVSWVRAGATRTARLA